MRPMNDCVFVKELRDTISCGGIILPVNGGEWDIENQDLKKGVVVSVGPGKVNKKGHRESMWGLASGQHIAFSPNGNLNVKVNGEELTMIRRDSIVGEIQ